MRLFAAVFSALLFILAFPDNPLPLLVWVCLVPWLFALQNTSTTNAFIVSLLFSAIPWLIYLWQPFYESALTIAANRGIAALLAGIHLFSYMLPFIVFGVLYKRFNSTTIKASIYQASVLTLLVMLIPTLFTFNLATFLYQYPLFLQLLDISGISLLFWVIVLVNLMLRNILIIAWQRQRLGHQFWHCLTRNISLLVMLGIVVLGYGLWQLPSRLIDNNHRVRIATIQPNMGNQLSPLALVRDSSQKPAYSAIELTREALKNNLPIDLIIWPENAKLIDCNHLIISQKISNFISEIKVPLMYQCSDCQHSDNNRQCYNQSRYIDANGNTRFHYNKQNLVPLFEWLPDTSLGSVVSTNINNEFIFKKGQTSVVFENPKAKVIPAICYDAHDLELIRQGIDNGGELLVIQSNDRIFKKSQIGLFDLAINIISSVSLRLPMVKASNSGYGAFVQETGHIILNSITPVYQRYTSVHEINLDRRYSLFYAYGDWFIYIAALIVIIGVIQKYD